MAKVIKATKELAFYYPNPVWYSGDWVKNLILFFDGIALLVPTYMKNRPQQVDPAIATGLKQHGLLHIIKPEKAVDKTATEKLAAAMTDVIASGALDHLSKEKTAFHELSMSRLGFHGDPELARMILEELKKRNLAQESEDNVSIPLHPMVRSLVLVLLSQILRPYGAKINAELSPATDVPRLVQALSELLTVKPSPSIGAVVAFDLNVVSVDLGPVPISFAALATDALAYSKAHKRSYDDDVIRMARLLTRFRERAADSITPQELEQHLAQTAEESNWAPATVNRYRALISLVFRLGIESGKVKENPARLVKHRQENNSRVRWLSGEEEVRLRAVISEVCPEHMPELDLALNTGLRLGELFGLVWENVNVGRRVLTVPRAKNGEMRHVPLNGPALAALAQLREHGNETGPVIRNAEGGPLSSPRYWFEPAIRGAKIRRFSWHCLRHTFASRLVMAGVDLRTVQELMGHKSIQMTVRYSHLTPKHTLAAVERLAGGGSETPTGTKTSTEADGQIFHQPPHVS